MKYTICKDVKQPLVKGYYTIEVNNCTFLCLFNGFKFDAEGDEEFKNLLDNTKEIKVKDLFKII